MSPGDLPSIRSAFVTGAQGFIGRSLVERLRARGVAVRGVDLRAELPTVVEGDVCELGEWAEHAAGCELFVHTAAIVSNAADLNEQWRVNVLGTRRALDAAVKAGAQRFIHLSSVRAFSDCDFPDGVDERWPVRPDGGAYVNTKIASEQCVLQAHAAGELDCTVIRPADVYGPGSRPWTILPVEMIKAGRFILPAMGRGLFSPLYIDNLLDAIELAAIHPHAVGEVFTIADAKSVTCAEFFGHYYRMLGKQRPVIAPTSITVCIAALLNATNRMRCRPSEANPRSVRYLARSGGYSILKARDMLGYVPHVDLEEGMRRTEQWLREQGLLGTGTSRP